MRRLLPALLCVVGILSALTLCMPRSHAQGAGPDLLLAPGARCASTEGHATEAPEAFGASTSAPTPRRYATYALLLLGLLAGFFAFDRAGVRASARTRLARGLLLLLALAALLALSVPIGPVHDHDVFVARAECAMDPGCDADRPGWMPPAYHAMGLLLSALPYRYPLVEGVGLALSLLALFVFAQALARVHRLRGDALRGQRVAWLAALFVALHPVWLRLSVAGTFWPWADLCLALAAWWAVWSSEHRSTPGWLASAAFFALALTSNVVFLALAPLALVAPWAWTRRAPSPRALLPLALLTFFAAPYAWSSVQQLGGAAASMPWLQKLASLPGNLVYLDPRLTPLPLGILFVLGLGVALRRWRRTLPLLYAFAVTELLLGSLQDLATGYPVRLIHGTTSLYFSAWLAAEGGIALVGWLRTRHHIRPAYTAAALALATLLAWPLCHEARAFAYGPRVLGPERRAFSHALDHLPEHDLLVVPPSIMDPIAGVSWGGDPLEARYPWGEYRAARAARGLPVAPIVSLPDYLARPEDFQDQRALLYVGASLRSFAPAEVDAGFAQAPFARPLLCDTLRAYTLEPVATFVLPTANHPASLLRLLGDARPTATLGFFLLQPRTRSAP